MIWENEETKDTDSPSVFFSGPKDDGRRMRGGRCLKNMGSWGLKKTLSIWIV
jgi:hypothetical protein